MELYLKARGLTPHWRYVGCNRVFDTTKGFVGFHKTNLHSDCYDIEDPVFGMSLDEISNTQCKIAGSDSCDFTYWRLGAQERNVFNVSWSPK